MTAQQLSVAVFKNARDNDPKQHQLSWDTLTAKLMLHEERETKDGPLWSPTLYRIGTNRGKANVEQVSCLVLDFDKGTPPAEFTRGWEPWAYVLHTTFQHTEEQPRWRVVFPLSIPIAGEDWPAVWVGLVKEFGSGQVDSSCRDASRIYYLPACPPAAERDAWANDGRWIDATEFLRPTEAVLLERARGELPSGRNNAGLWLACQMRDNGYSQSETERLEWHREVPTAKQSPTGQIDEYTEGEWLETVRKAFGRGKREPWRPSSNGTHPKESLNSLISLSSLTGGEESGWPAPLAPEAFHGIAGEIVREIEPETEADESALLLNLLATFGNAVGRGPHGLVGKTRHYPNLFVGLCGYTGDARKGTSWDPIHDLYERALPLYTGEHIQGSIATGEGLIALVRDRFEKRVQIKDKKSGRMTMEFETVVEDEGVDDKRLLIVDSEMSGILKVMTRSGNILSEELRKAWETGTLQINNKNSPMKATGAHISIIGHITPDGLRKHLTEAEAANGFGNRFLLMLCKRSKLLPEGGNLPHLNSFITPIRELIQQASDIREMRRDVHAAKIWASVYEDLNRPGAGMAGELIARRAPIVLRLSIIYALLDGVRLILPAHVMAALAVWERSESSVRLLFGEATGDPTADALYEAMLARPEGATRTDLHAAVGRNRPVSDIDRALTVLHRTGRAAMVRQKGHGEREVEAWHAGGGRGSSPGSCYMAKARAVMAEMELAQ